MSIFTEDQVASMNAYQQCGRWHPFTCGNGCRASVLLATPDGWVCPDGCGYTQDWAHKFMVDWAWKKTVDAMDRADEKCGDRYGMGK